MSRGKQTYEKDTRSLVRSVTGFEEDEEQFDLCVSFVLSNIKYHRFLDPDSHKLHRQITGLGEKFQIHSQNEKAESFKNLVTNFLESPVFEDKEHGKTGTHYAVLSFLLCLSETPTHVIYDERTGKQLAEAGDSFDWTSYLLEDIDYCTGPFPESPEWSDDDDFEETNVKPRLTFGLCSQGHSKNLSITGTCPDDLTLIPELNMQSCDWLRQNLIVQYWSRRELIPVSSSSHRESSLTFDWEAYQSSTNTMLAPTEKMLVTEYHIVRETLWMLLGVPCSVVYVWSGTKYTSNSDLTVSHLTQESLSSLLIDLCRYGTLVRHLYTFTSNISSAAVNSCHGNIPISVVTSCQTYQAFSAALSVFLQHMQQDLIKLERHICMQENISTLSQLLQDLAPLLMNLDTLQTVYTNGIAAFDHVTSVSQKASGLLGVLFDVLMECDNMGEHSCNKVSLLLVLWVKSCKPYLDIIDKWSTYGNLVDPYKEFIIQRNMEIHSLDEHFWDTGFMLHCEEPLPDQERPVHGTAANQLAPRFLLPVLDQVIIAGKSMELIQHLGRLTQVLKGSTRKSLYELFIESMETMHGNQPDAIETQPDDDKSIVTRADHMTTIFKESIAEQMRIPGVSDPLLRVNFINLFNADVLQAKSLSTQEDNIHSRLERLHLKSLTPIELLLSRCLYPHISTVSTSLLHILKQEYKLMDYFTAIRKYFLMEAGDLMYNFYTQIFEKLRLRESWQDVSFLNSSLQESLQACPFNDGENVYVSVEPVNERHNQRKQLVGALSGLTLHYKIPWPVDIIINSRCLHAYKEVFSFILQIKWVKYSLDELRFADFKKVELVTEDNVEQCILGTVKDVLSQRQDLIHRTQIMRMKLMHFVNNLHNHIMTRILHSTVLEFEAELNEATNLDCVIKAHNTYVNNIHGRCLLHKMVSIIKDIVTSVLNLALVLAFKWNEGISSFSEDELRDLESEFSRCILFLSSLLNTTIKRGSFPHLESLAFALVSSNEAMQSSGRSVDAHNS